MKGKQRTFSYSVIKMLVVVAILFAPAGMAFADEESIKAIEDSPTIYFLLFDQLEYRRDNGQDTFHWDIQGWIGGDYNKFWIKTEGDQQFSGKSKGEAEVQLLYSRLISPYFDFQAGIRHDEITGDDHRSRSFGVLGIQGLGLHWFEVDLSLYVSQDGDVSARFTGEYDLLLTQRLVLQPRLETELAVQEVEAFGQGVGFNYVELGARLRYEIHRKFAPYVGVSWKRLLGETSHIAQRNGEETDSLALVIGVRLWF